MGYPRALSASAGRPLPLVRSGWFDLTCAVTQDQRLIRLTANADVRANWRLRGPGPLYPPGTRAAIELFDWSRADAVETVEFELDGPFPEVDRLSDGRWIVANSRCQAGAANALILAPDGAVLDRLHLGDGISHLQSDAEGTIWVGYFDEGVFGNGRGSASPRIGGGLTRFSPTGVPLWAWNADGGAPTIDDCYSMNVAPDGVWSCFYSDFPILRVTSALEARIWDNDVIGANLIASSGRHVVLFGGYSADRGRITLLRLGDRVAEPVREGALALPGWEDGVALARGDRLHFVVAGVWHVLTVDEVLAAWT